MFLFDFDGMKGLICRSKHQTIEIQTVSTLVEPRLHALRYISISTYICKLIRFRNRENFSQDVHVEKEIRRLNDEADRQIRLLKHKSDGVRLPTSSSLPLKMYFL